MSSVDNLEQIAEGVRQIELWHKTAEAVLDGKLEFDQEVHQAAAIITDQLLAGELSMRKLRGGIYWANALEKEMFNKYGADISQGDEQQERMARRLMHHTVRAALQGFKSEKRRIERRAEQARYTWGMVG